MKIITENGNTDVFLRDVNYLQIQKNKDNLLPEYILGVCLCGHENIYEVFGSRTFSDFHVVKMYSNFAEAKAEGFKAQKLKYECILNMLNVNEIRNNEISFKDGSKLSVSSKALEGVNFKAKKSFYK